MFACAGGWVGGCGTCVRACPRANTHTRAHSTYIYTRTKKHSSEHVRASARAHTHTHTHTHTVFGVFDGHGQVGHTVSQFVKRKWPENMDRALMKGETKNPGNGEQVRKMLERSFTETNKMLEMDRQIDSSLSGTTATGGVVYGPPSRRLVAIANAGDSRCIIATERDGELICTPLSDDHKPDRPDERKRIEESGGRVEPLFDEDGEPIGPARVWLPHMVLFVFSLIAFC